MTERARKRAQAGWMLHEFAHQPFLSLVTMFIFAPWFANGVIGDPVRGAEYWGYLQAGAAVLIALLSPVLGAIADQTGRRKPWFVTFVALCAISSASLWFAAPGIGPAPFLLLAIVLAKASVEFAIVFSNAMLPDIAREERYGVLSGISFAGGQIAVVITLVATLFWFQIPDAPALGLDKAMGEHNRIVGPLSALWYLTFVIPLCLFAPDRPRSPVPLRAAAIAGIKGVARTLRHAGHYREVSFFLAARMFYYDGLNAVFVFGAILASQLFGWGGLETALFGLTVCLTSTLGGFSASVIVRHLGEKRTILVGLIFAFVLVIGIISTDGGHIYWIAVVPGTILGMENGEFAWSVLAALFAFAMGPVIAPARALLARLAPPEMMTEFFGLFTFTAKAATLVTPLLIGVIASTTGSLRAGLALVLLWVAIGFYLLLKVRLTRAQALSV